MNKFIKHIIEAFDFNSVNKQKKQINLYGQILDILQKPYKQLTKEDVSFLRGIELPDNFYKAKDRNDLVQIIKNGIKIYRNNGNLNWIDVSNITDMHNLFSHSKFNGNISRWNVSNVRNMNSMFHKSLFDGDISQWDVSNVTDMGRMFRDSSFNGDISNWNVSKVTNMSKMFFQAWFDRDLNNWNTKSLIDMDGIFYCSGVSNHLPKWFDPNKDSIYPYVTR